MTCCMTVCRDHVSIGGLFTGERSSTERIGSPVRMRTYDPLLNGNRVRAERVPAESVRSNRATGSHHDASHKSEQRGSVDSALNLKTR